MEEDSGLRQLDLDGRVYVLRVWYEQPEARSWRATLRGGATGERRHFASIDDCLEHLYTELVRR